MILKFYCPECAAKIEADLLDCGDMFPCPVCENTIQVPEDEFGPGVAIGAFEIIRKLGEGGMGTVYLAEQTSLRRIVALKVLSPAFTTSEDFVENFLREMQVQGSIAHPNIVSAFDAGSDRDIHYLAMEYIDGEELETILEREETLPETRSLQIIRQVAGALMHAWKKRQIVHRDIKPGNIMIDDRGNAQLLDLGLSTSIVHPEDQEGTRYMVGTPQYMPPEQIRGEEGIDFRADIYALGGTLYHMVTGLPPHEGSSVTEVTDKQLAVEPTDPRTLNLDLSEPCHRLIARMLNKDPMQRFSSWDRLIDAIDLVSDHLNGRVRTVETPKVVVAPPPERTNKAVLVAWGIGIAALLAVLFSIMGNNNAPNPDTSSTLPPARLISDTQPTDPAPPGTLEPGISQIPSTTLPKKSTEADGNRTTTPGLSALLDQANERVKNKPTAYTENIALYQILLESAQEEDNDDVIAQIEKRITLQKRNRNDAIEELNTRLFAEAQALADEGDHDNAMALLRNYNGELAGENQFWRNQAATQIGTEKRRNRTKPMREAAMWSAVLSQVAAELVKTRSMNSALSSIDDAIHTRRHQLEHTAIGSTPSANPAHLEDWLALKTKLESATPNNITEFILKSFAEHVGQPAIPVQFRTGESRLCEIEGIDPPRVLIKIKSGETVGQIGVPVSDFSDTECIRRLEAIAPNDADFLLGIHYLFRRLDILARPHLEQVEHPLGEAILHELETSKREPTTLTAQAEPENPAQTDFGYLLELAGLDALMRNPVPAILVAQFRSKEYTTQHIQLIKTAARRFEAAHLGSPTLTRYRPLLTAMKNLAIPGSSRHGAGTHAPRLVDR